MCWSLQWWCGLQSQKSLLHVSAFPLGAQNRLNYLLFRWEARLCHCVDVTFCPLLHCIHRLPWTPYAAPYINISATCFRTFTVQMPTSTPLHITIGWRIRGKRSIRLRPYIIRTGQNYWIPHDRSGGNQNWYWLGKSGNPGCPSPLDQLPFYSFQLRNFIIIQVWRVATNICLLNKQSRAVDMEWSFGLNIWCRIFIPSS